MWGTASLVLHVALLWQGVASEDTPQVSAGSGVDLNNLDFDNGANIVLDPDKPPSLLIPGHLQKERDQRIQDLQQSQAQIMALVQNLQEENSQLKKQQETYQAINNEMWEHLQNASQQTQRQVSDLVGEMRGQKETVEALVELVKGVLDAVRDVEDKTGRVISSPTQDRLASVEASVLLLEVKGNDLAKNLTAVQQRMEDLELLMWTLLGGQGGETSPTPLSTTPSAVPMTTRDYPRTALSNVALHKPALQSTYHPLYGNPEKAVDGGKGIFISQCTHTADIDSNPNRWWRVDLMGLFEVEAVVITNRGDCCGYRLSEFYIYVMKTLLDSSEEDHYSSDLCLHHNEQIADGATVRLECGHPLIGRYVSLVLPTDSWPLNFCEMEVLGRPAVELSNVALNKPALQSTYHPLYGNPEKAVDGNKATFISQCTHTADIDSNPIRWWRVDLMGLFEVETVVITNRGDCCGNRLSNFDIYVVKELLDPSENKHYSGDLCLHRDQPVLDGVTLRLECDRPIVGQYVSLVLRTGAWPLNFCEIEVLGRPASASTPATTQAPPPPSTSQSTSSTTSEVEGSGEDSEVDEDSGDYDFGYWGYMHGHY